MEYNTEREKLIIPEYGRHIQKMVNYLIDIKDKDKRTRLAYAIVSIMDQMTTGNKEGGETKQKLWDHLHYISEFELDIDSPFEAPKPIENNRVKVEYSTNKIKYRYYGKNMENLIEKISEYENGPEKEKLIEMMANHLKKQYLLWNKEIVEDQTVFGHLAELSGGKIKASDDVNLNSTSEILSRGRRKRTTNTNHSKKKNGSYKPKSNYKKRHQ